MQLTMWTAKARVSYETRVIQSADPTQITLIELRKGNREVNLLECFGSWRLTGGGGGEISLAKQSHVDRILKRLGWPTVEEIENDVLRYIEDMEGEPEDPMGDPAFER